jgi:aromatic ring-cleaving dioxygenase
MSLFADYHTEAALAAEIKKKTGRGSKRMLQRWRERRIGPPWVKMGKTILYPDDGFRAWLKKLQHPAGAL